MSAPKPQSKPAPVAQPNGLKIKSSVKAGPEIVVGSDSGS